MQNYKLNKIGECKIKPTNFKFLPAQVQIFSQNLTLSVRAFAIHAIAIHAIYRHTRHTRHLSDKEIFCHNIALKIGFWFDHDNCYVNNFERPFFPREIEACRELARVDLISKNH